MIIRQFEKRDTEDVRYICLNCDGPSDMTPEGEHFILVTYCDYFIEKEGHNCFVACDENDKAVGYILCAENYDKFIECFRNEYIPKIPEEQKEHRFYASTSAVLQGKYKDEYPAHLHIDILPEYQRMGLGHKLTDALCSHLKSKKVKAVMLTVNPENIKGAAFYEKYGFSLIESTPTDLVYGIKFSDEE